MVPRTYRILRALLLTLTLSGTACIPIGDPEGPGAQGTAEIPTDVDMKPYQTLVVRMVPRDGDFDPDAPDFGKSDDAIADGRELDGDRTVAYSVGEVLGTTPHKHWRLFAWLSADDDWWEDGLAGRPSEGVPYGVADFDVDRCDPGYGDYCGVTHGVNVTLEQVAP